MWFQAHTQISSAESNYDTSTQLWHHWISKMTNKKCKLLSARRDSTWCTSALVTIYLSLSHSLSLECVFYYCFGCHTSDWREIHFRIYIFFHFVLNICSAARTFLRSVALIFMRLQKYVRNKYFKLSRKSKTVNGMMYQRQLSFPIVSSFLVCRRRCRNFQL